MLTAIEKTPKPSATELLNIAARLDTLADTFKKYESAYNHLRGAASNVRSAVGHAMVEIEAEKEEIEDAQIEEIESEV